MKLCKSLFRSGLSLFLTFSLLVGCLLSVSVSAADAEGDSGAASANTYSFAATDHGKSRTNVSGGYGTLYSDIPAVSFRSTQTTESDVYDGIVLSGLREVDWNSGSYDALVMDVEFVNAGRAQGVLLVLDVLNTETNTVRKMYSITNGMEFYRLPTVHGADGEMSSLVHTASNFGWLYASAKGYTNAQTNNHTTTESFLGKFIVPFESLENGFAATRGSAVAATGADAIDLSRDRILSVGMATVLKWGFQFMNFNMGTVSLGKLNTTDEAAAALSALEPIWQPVAEDGTAAKPAGENVTGNTYARYGSDASVSLFLFTRPGIHFAANNDKFETVDFQYAPEMVADDGTVDLNGYDGFLMDWDFSEFDKSKFVHFAFGLFNSSSKELVTNDRWYSGNGLYYCIPDNAPAYYPAGKMNGLAANTKYGQKETYVGQIYFPFDASCFTKGSSAGNFPKGEGETSANLIRFWFSCASNYGGTVYFQNVTFVKSIHRYLTDTGAGTTVADMNAATLSGNGVLLTGAGSGKAAATFKMNSYYSDYQSYGNYFILEQSSALAIRLKNPCREAVRLKVTVWESSSEQLDLCDASKTAAWTFVNRSGREEQLPVSGGYVTLPAGCDGVLMADYSIAKSSSGKDGKVNNGLWNLLLTMDMSSNQASKLVVGEISVRQSAGMEEPFYIPLCLEGNNDKTAPTSKYSWNETETLKVSAYQGARGAAAYKGVQESAVGADQTFNIRLVATIDRLDYDSAGMRMTVTDANGTRSRDQEITTVYQSLLGTTASGLEAYTAEELNGNYLMAVIIDHIPAEGTVTFTVTPYCVKNNVTTEGETYRVTYVNGVYQPEN